MKVPPWAWLTWVLAFVVMEALALVNSNPGDTLTETIVRYIPAFAIFMGIGWLGWHFAITILNHRAGKKGR